MRPILSIQNQIDRFTDDAVTAGKFRGSVRGVANRTNVVLCELGFVVVCTARSSFWHSIVPVTFALTVLISAALIPSIGDVLLLCAEPQVGRVYAQAIIASMANNSIGWDVAVSQPPCDPMGALTYAVEFSESVTRSADFASPRPATVRLHHMSPESGWFHGVSINHFMTVVVA